MVWNWMLRNLATGKTLVRLAACGLLFGCGASAEPLGTTETESVGDSEQFVVWMSGSNPLVTEHTNWHSRCGSIPGSRSCSNMGTDFLVFHRDYMRRLRNEFFRLNQNHNIDPWYRVPAEMRLSANGWTSALAAAETAIYTNRDPNNGNQPFRDLNAFGEFLENRFHNALHGIAQRTYGEAAIGPVNMAPTSTYFFKIHGLVEYLFQRFERNDFTRDGSSDIFVRDPSNGRNWVGSTRGVGQSVVWTDMATVPHDRCDWRLGGAADFNTDGWKDLVWLSKACNQVSIEMMRGQEVLHGSILEYPDPSYTYIGSADFSGDLQPEIVWASPTHVVYWHLTEDQTVDFVTSTSLPTRMRNGLRGIGDMDDDGQMDLLYAAAADSSTYQLHIQYMNRKAFASSGTRRTNVGTFSAFQQLVGAGNYHQRGMVYADPVFWNVPPCNCASSFGEVPWSPSQAGTYNDLSIVKLDEQPFGVYMSVPR